MDKVFGERELWQFRWNKENGNEHDLLSNVTEDAIMLPPQVDREWIFLRYAYSDPSRGYKIFATTHNVRTYAWDDGLLVDYQNVAEYTLMSRIYREEVYASQPREWINLEPCLGWQGVTRSPALTYFGNEVIPGKTAPREQQAQLGLVLCPQRPAWSLARVLDALDILAAQDVAPHELHDGRLGSAWR